MNVTAMIRSEDLIKASRSGAQIETYDSKLEAFIRKKAISLENAEFQLWKVWHDWMGLTVSDDLVIEYNKFYGNKGIQNGINEVTSLIDLFNKYQNEFSTMNTSEEGYHTMVNPATGEQREVANDGEEHMTLSEQGWIHPTNTYTEDSEIEDIKDSIKQRFKQIIMASYTENSQ
jgi:hypothetical protein